MRPNDQIETKRLILRHWQRPQDGNAFFRLNNDPEIMRFFPSRRTRVECEQHLDLIEKQLEQNGYSWCAITLKSSGNVIGFGGIAKVDEGFPNGPSAEIGWRFVPESWGNGYATEMGCAIIDYGFETLRLPEILSFATPANTASTAVMQRIGMERLAQGDFDHPNIPRDEYPDIVRHVCYRLTHEQWLKQKTAG